MRSILVGVIAGLMLFALPVAAQETAQSPASATTNESLAQLSGQVLDAVSGRPVRAALIGVAELGQWTMADGKGVFRLINVPPGDQELVVRAIGYSPVHVTTQFMARDSLSMQVVLTPIPPTLSTVRVEAEFEERYAMRLRQFEESRSMGIGRFLDWRFFEKHKNTSVSSLLHGRFGALRVGLAGIDGGNRLLITRSGIPCMPVMWVNGLREDAPSIRLDWLNTSDILGFEFYTPATTPARYNATGAPSARALEPSGGAACGTVVLWLK